MVYFKLGVATCDSRGHTRIPLSRAWPRLAPALFLRILSPSSHVVVKPPRCFHSNNPNFTGKLRFGEADKEGWLLRGVSSSSWRGGQCGPCAGRADVRDLHGTFQAKRGARGAPVPAPLPRKVRGVLVVLIAFPLSAAALV